MADARPIETATDDAFAGKDRLTGAGEFFDIHSMFDEIRTEGTCLPGPLSERLGWNGYERAQFGARDQFSLLGYDEIDSALRNANASASYAGESMVPIIGPNLLGMDGSDHQRWRLLLSPMFRKAAVTTWEQRWVRPALEERIARFQSIGRADLQSELAFSYPIDVLARAMGLAGNLDEFYRLSVTITNPLADQAVRLACSASLREVFRDLVAKARQDPPDNLVGWLVSASHQRVAPLTDDEIVNFLRLLLPAGAQTTYRALCNLLFAILTQDDQMELLRRDPSRIPDAADEAVRWEPPLTTIGRIATGPIDLGDQVIPAGCPMHMSIVSADHDADRWIDPHQFDLARPSRPHLGFGIGAHVCLGIHIARQEMAVAVEVLLDRFPDLRLDVSRETPAISGALYRNPQSLPVVFTPVGAKHD